MWSNISYPKPWKWIPDIDAQGVENPGGGSRRFWAFPEEGFFWKIEGFPIFAFYYIFINKISKRALFLSSLSFLCGSVVPNDANNNEINFSFIYERKSHLISRSFLKNGSPSYKSNGAMFFCFVNSNLVSGGLKLVETWKIWKLNWQINQFLKY